jgi:hypothetical protein
MQVFIYCLVISSVFFCLSVLFWRDKRKTKLFFLISLFFVLVSWIIGVTLHDISNKNLFFIFFIFLFPCSGTLGYILLSFWKEYK